jgi:hypothetical protein
LVGRRGWPDLQEYWQTWGTALVAGRDGGRAACPGAWPR